METLKKSSGVVFQVPKEDRTYIENKAFTPIEIIETEEVNDDEFGCVRLYSNYIGDPKKNENHFTLQIRAFQSLKRGNKKKNIIASVSLSDSEIMELANYVKKKRKKFNTYVEIDCD